MHSEVAVKYVTLRNITCGNISGNVDRVGELATSCNNKYTSDIGVSVGLSLSKR
jgi:hypothetical protein